MADNNTSVPSPDLRIIPIARITPHEEEDPQRAGPLSTAIADDGFLANPIIVTQLDTAGYLLLDGTNRYTAFGILGIPHILAQVVDYNSPQVELHTWNHVLAADNEAEFRKGLQTVEREHIAISEAPKPAANILATIHFQNSPSLAVHTDYADIAHHIDYLRRLVARYIQLGRLNRSTIGDFRTAQTIYPDMTALVHFMTFTPQHIIDLVQGGGRAPAGVTRHVIHGRALRVNYPLSELQSDLDVEDKTSFLQNWLAKKFAQRQVRLYTESTYQFEE